MLQNPMRMTILAVLLMSYAHHARADWTRFRGPNGSGISDSSIKMPERWNGSANLKWKTSLPGPGVSSPIVVGDRVYVTCYSGYGLDRKSPGDEKNLKRHLVCIDRRSGKLLWNREVAAVLPEDPYAGVGVPAHGYASSTPVSDGENVYVFFGKTGALAFDKDGKQLWQTSVGKESDPMRWGSASSPIVYKNVLIVPATAESEALVALDTKTGKEVWRQEASGFSNSWSTPILVQAKDGGTDLVIGVPNEIWGLNPETGKLRWYCESAKARSFCSSPVSDGEVVYAMEGQSGASIAIRAGGRGDVTSSHRLWTGRTGGRFGSPIVRNGRIYSFANGIVTVIDAKTGEQLSQLRLEGGSSASSGSDYASPIFADGKFYMVRRSGDVFVLRGDDTLKTLAVNRLTDETEDFAATPAAGDGELYIRSDKHLYCVAELGHKVPISVRAGDGAASDEGTAGEQPGGEAVAHGGGSDRQRTGSSDGQRGGGYGAGGSRGSGGFDPAAMFERMDTDKDGKLAGEEISERMRGRMEQLDSDKDGAITLKEFQSGMSRMFSGGGRGGSGGSPRQGKPERPQRPGMEP